MNSPTLSKSASRFRAALAAKGHEIDVVALSDSTRTAQEADGNFVKQKIGYAIGGVFRLAPADLPVITGAHWYEIAE